MLWEMRLTSHVVLISDMQFLPLFSLSLMPDTAKKIFLLFKTVWLCLDILRLIEVIMDCRQPSAHATHYWKEDARDDVASQSQ